MKILCVGEEKGIGKNRSLIISFVHNTRTSIRYPKTQISQHRNEVKLRIGDMFDFCEMTVPLNGFIPLADSVIEKINADDIDFSLCLIAPVIDLTKNIDDQIHLNEGLLRIREKYGQLILEGVKDKSDTKTIFTATITKDDLEKIVRLAREAKKYLGEEFSPETGIIYLPEEEIPF